MSKMKIISVDEYVSSINENGQKAVKSFIDYMHTEFPEIKPVISYSMPMWKLGKKMYDGYVAISAAKEHYSIHFYDETRIAQLMEVLPGCTFGKRCINIKYDDETVKTVVILRVKDYIKDNIFNVGA